MEQVCDYNGQSVLTDERTGKPLTYHDCGYDDCELCWKHSEASSRADTGTARPLNFDNDDWEGAYEWFEGLEE